MAEKKDVTVPMDEQLVDAIEEQLDYGDSRAEWIREAVRERLARDSGDGGNRTPTSAD